LSYITSRGHWYYSSWKSNQSKSGGIATNIGVHLFDLLCWMFGGLKHLDLHRHSHDRAAGTLQFEKADVRWFLSINENTLPEDAIKQGQRTFRSLKIGQETFDFSSGFEDLHVLSYQKILSGEGFGLEDCRASISLCSDIRRSMPQLQSEALMHPLARLEQTPHPFGGR
jgi:UDP-N-acetyl-2-amino-2-deoxyglucuronate dehydrogenase